MYPFSTDTRKLTGIWKSSNYIFYLILQSNAFHKFFLRMQISRFLVKNSRRCLGTFHTEILGCKLIRKPKSRLSTTTTFLLAHSRWSSDISVAWLKILYVASLWWILCCIWQQRIFWLTFVTHCSFCLIYRCWFIKFVSKIKHINI